MKVFIVTVEPFPHGMAGTSRIICYAKAILNAGIECEVVGFHRTEVYGQKPNNTTGQGTYEGIAFRYMGGTPLRASNVLLRQFHDWKDKRDLLSYLEHNMKKGDCILTYYRQNKMDRRLLKFANENDFPVYRDLCEYPYATNQLNEKTKERSEWYLTNVFPQYTGAICISHPLYDLAKKYNPKGNHIIIPILIDPSKWNFSTVKDNSLNTPYIFHSGTVYQQKDGIVDVLSAFADALPQLPQDVCYFFTGTVEKSPDRDMITKTISERHLENRVKFLGFLSDDELREYIKGSSCFIINKNDNLQNRYCFATKLGGYLLSGNPVITTDIGEPNYYLTNGQNAFIVKHGDGKGLANAIVRVFSNKKESKAVGEAGRKLAEEHFCYKAQSEAMKELFCKVNDNIK